MEIPTITTKEAFIAQLANAEGIPMEVKIGIPIIEAMFEDMNEEDFQEMVEKLRCALCPECPMRKKEPTE